MPFTTPVASGTEFGSATIGGVQVPTNLIMDASGNEAVAQLLDALASPALAPATSTPLTGTSNGAQVVEFIPQLARPINLVLSYANGVTGTVQLLRSIDGTQGNARPITLLGAAAYSWTGSAQEIGLLAETQVGATYWLSLPATGIFYDMRQ